MKIKTLSLAATLLLIVNSLFHTHSFSQGTWTQKAVFGGGVRHAAAGFSIGTKGYIGTGYDAISCVSENDFWEWDQATNVWTQKADFGGTGRDGAVGFSIGTNGYIGTGVDNSGYTQDFWEWDQTNNTWAKKVDFGGGPRSAATGFSIGTKGYIGVGNGTTGNKQDFWEWDQTANTWTQKNNFGGAARRGAAGFSIGTKGYIGTGYDNSFLQDFWEWDQSADTWTQKTNFGGTAREHSAGFSIGNKGYIGTGRDGAGINAYKKDFWEWNQATGAWSKKTDFGGTIRGSAVGFSIGNKGYIGTGQRGAVLSQQDFWEYDSAGVTSISEIIVTVTVSVHPNPFFTQCVFTLNEEIHDGVLAIYDLSGKTAKKINFSGNRITVEREGLPAGQAGISSGVYFYQVCSHSLKGEGKGTIISTGKIIVQ